MTDTLPRDPHGVSFTAFATVQAGLDDGFSLEQMLAFVGVAKSAWARAEAAWSERILDDLEAGGALDEALYTAKAQAQRGWLRRLPPLDTDLDAWLAFSMEWAQVTDPGPFLSELGMRMADLTRLETLWGARLEADPALKMQAVRILSEPPRPFPKPAPTGPDLPRKDLPALRAPAGSSAPALEPGTKR